ncbi:conserved phage C-terminal domain-containing protein [Fusobacterium periodonticum]|uniref:conserved phage C-terminal domain-containing protein n=1 Tax=Fusobacterium periodonticum TaxID=860 RepID=UPI0020612957|nr:conserved phage C-terminal domain-containing protein [Fusobacterium periodonticum]DAM59415.1 MAG TPA: hypothetical protein [Caudoviricetes sp.]
MRDIREKNWFWLENDLVDREDISAMEKLIYMLLARYADKEGKCFPSQDKLCKITGIKDYRTIVKYLKQLEEKGLIEIKKNNGKVNVYYLKNVSTPPTKNVGTKNATANFVEEPPTKNVGTPPTNFAGITIHNKKDTINNTQYIKEIEEVVIHLNEKAGTKYKYNSKNTTKHIQARIREGYTLEDFKTVIDKKCSEWLNTDMEKYLCPETLFGSKFEKYLNQKIIHKNIGISTSTQETKKIKWGE